MSLESDRQVQSMKSPRSLEQNPQTVIDLTFDAVIDLTDDSPPMVHPCKSDTNKHSRSDADQKPTEHDMAKVTLSKRKKSKYIIRKGGVVLYFKMFNFMQWRDIAWGTVRRIDKESVLSDNNDIIDWFFKIQVFRWVQTYRSSTQKHLQRSHKEVL